MMYQSYIGKTIEYEGPAWTYNGIQFLYSGLLDIEEFDSNEYGSCFNCWVTNEPQLEEAMERGWVVIDDLPDIIYYPGEILPDVERILSEVSDARIEYVHWLDDILERRFGI